MIVLIKEQIICIQIERKKKGSSRNGPSKGGTSKVQPKKKATKTQSPDKTETSKYSIIQSYFVSCQF